MNSQIAQSGIDQKHISRIEQSAFIFDLKSILAPSSSAFSAPVVPTTTLNRLNYLSRLCFGSVAVISDRELPRLEAILCSAANNLFLIGSHGGELKTHTGDYRSATPSDALNQVRDRVRQFVADMKPAYVENKKLGIAVHFGPAPELSGIIYKKLSQIGDLLGTGFQVVEGHYYWELKPAIHNKGVALTRLLKLPEFADKTPYFFGTDHSAESAFLAAQLAQGFAVQVGDKRTNSRAQYHVENSVAVEDWLKRLCIDRAIPELSGASRPVRSKAA